MTALKKIQFVTLLEFEPWTVHLIARRNIDFTRPQYRFYCVKLRRVFGNVCPQDPLTQKFEQSIQSEYIVSLYLYDKPTDAPLQICSVTYFSHPCDHKQGVL